MKPLPLLRTLGCASALAAAAGVHAQQTPATSNVTLYGLIDATISTVNHADKGGDRLTGFQTPWFSGSRWGLTTREDLGGGLNVIAKLESEFVIQTGEEDTPGVLFNRDAWVGFQSADWGKLTVGRQNALGRDISAIYGDPYTISAVSTEETGYTNTNNFKQLIFYAGSATGTRVDNGVVWKKLWTNGVFAGVGYQFGEVPGQFSKNTTTTAALGYNGAFYHVSGFYDHANVNGLIHNSYSAGGNVEFGEWRLYGGYYHYKAEQAVVGDRKDDAFTISTKFAPAGSWDYELGFQVLKAGNAGLTASGNTLTPFKDTTGVTASGTGRKKTLYGSVFYHLSKRTELYVAADYAKTTDKYVVGSFNGFDSQTELAVGMRTRF